MVGLASGALSADEGKSVVLRMSVGGGLTPEAVALIEVPIFTLYGDGTIIYNRSPSDRAPGILWTTRLSMEAGDGLVADAIAVLGPQPKRGDGRSESIADAATTTFTLNTAESQVVQSFDALGVGGEAPAAIVDFAARLAGVDDWLADDVDAIPFSPDLYLASIIEEDPKSPGAKEWPWADISVDEFVSMPDGGFAASALLRPDQVAAIVAVPSGPRSDIVLATPDGYAFRLLLRPLLPDEVEVDAPA
jgi:hypothetical protein